MTIRERQIQIDNHLREWLQTDRFGASVLRNQVDPQKAEAVAKDLASYLKDRLCMTLLDLPEDAPPAV